ncbi:hypothetical protein [Pseudonocardia asaccharolytica]|uniref:Uncharacterized protein n=1 Tax=Pseudonocardia asaccharolytica DSM 44247 = NBRC 16224 TaxID=1123024 RepID=A0A511D1Q3_9PSEU|nr:hypothetical protein [Pseudonocardia asaccharolytica]GEL18617.1 hypothetical protein PA7_24540 [Pseudonocardia asaccharolytica DSM 44247 = NBRC 16224]
MNTLLIVTLGILVIGALLVRLVSRLAGVETYTISAADFADDAGALPADTSVSYTAAPSPGTRS